MNIMEHTLLALSLGLLLTASTCVNSENLFPESESQSVETLNSHSLHNVEKRSPTVPSAEDGDNENAAVEGLDDGLDSPEYTDKRGGLFRFGKRQGMPFRFGKRQGSLFRFGKRQGSLFRFGKRGGSLLRFGRNGNAQDSVDDSLLDKRTLFRFGRRSDVLPRVLAQADLLNNPTYLESLDN